MSTNFDRAFAVVVGAEGGYSADPRDPGNWTGGRTGVGALHGTKWGIAANSHPGLDIRGLTLDGAKAIYRREYWDTIKGDELPAGLALLVFDAAVNCGPGRAVRWLQAAAGAVPDGALGGATLAAVRSRCASGTEAGGVALMTECLAQRMAYMAGLPGWTSFGLGWARRLCALPFHALRLEAGP